MTPRGPSKGALSALLKGPSYLRLVTHFQFLIVGPDQEMATKRPYNWSPGLILGAFCTIFRARPVGTGLGAKFGRKPAKNQS